MAHCDEHRDLVSAHALPGYRHQVTRRGTSRREDVVRSRYEEAGGFVVRIGNPPKRAIPFRKDTPFDKITVNLIAPNGDTSSFGPDPMTYRNGAER
jgi:hypothetical protein